MVSEQADKDTTLAADHSVSENSAARPEPVFLYVHHLREDPDTHKYPMYLFQLEGSDLIDQVHAAIDDIIEERVKSVPISSDGEYHWRVYSYVAFILDEEEIVSVDFLDEDGKTHSFDKYFIPPKYNGHWSIVYLNHRTNKHGRRLGPNDSEPFEWIVNHRVPGHESSTTNTGP